MHPSLRHFLTFSQCLQQTPPPLEFLVHPNVKRYTLKITRVIAICTNPASLLQELLWVDIFLFRPGTPRPSTEHHLETRKALIFRRFFSPFSLICKLLVSFTGILTTCFSHALASVLLILLVLHPSALLLPVQSVCSPKVILR